MVDNKYIEAWNKRITHKNLYDLKIPLERKAPIYKNQ